MKLSESKIVRDIRIIMLWHVWVAAVYLITYYTFVAAWVSKNSHTWLTGVGVSPRISNTVSVSFTWMLLITPGTVVISKWLIPRRTRTSKRYGWIAIISSVTAFFVVYDLMDFFSIVDKLKSFAWRHWGTSEFFEYLYYYIQPWEKLLKWEVSAVGLFVVFWIFRHFQSHPQGNICEKCG